ncbi:hypothetical protein OE88DRAFT_1643517 [Heliocybe sulcata]|uniref:Osmotin, thaumatin-like protein n=1 Tax=Heliocybe sulcata TaxID=5364 RepID=A0A5C3N9T5_9AGAM|nr:hypothetical protein OE88DRAFT_1643517 [Heliocybe sulcata]
MSDDRERPTLAMGRSAEFLRAQRLSTHNLIVHNKCTSPIDLKISDDAAWARANYTGPTPTSMAPDAHQTLVVPEAWAGHLWAETGSCGAGGTHCTYTQIILDTDVSIAPNVYFPQRYNVNAIETRIIGCDAAICASADCDAAASSGTCGQIGAVAVYDRYPEWCIVWDT